MTSTPPDQAQPPAGPRKLDSFFDSIRRAGVWRTDDRWFGGVAAGLAHRVGIDPLIVRGLFVLITLFGGFGVLLYGIAWLLLPEARDGRIHLQQALNGNFEAGFIGATVMTVVGLSKPAWWFHTPWFVSLVVLGLVAGVVIAILSGGSTNTRQPAPGYPAPGPAPTPAPAPGAPYAGTSGFTGAPTTTVFAPPPPPASPQSSAAPTAGPTQGGPVPPSSFRVTPLPSATTASTATASTVTASPAAAAYPAAAATPTSTASVPAPFGTVHAAPAPTPAGTAPWPTTPAPPAGGYPPATPPPGWGAGGYATPGTPSGPVPPQGPPPTPTRGHHGPGKALIGVTTGIALLVVAGILLFAWGWSNAFALSVGAALVVFGLGIVVAGALGRSSGTLGFLSIMTIVFLLPFAAASIVWPHGWHGAPRDWVASGTIRPLTVADATAGISVGAGDLEVDLTQLDLSGQQGEVVVPIDYGAGSLTVNVPSDVPVRVDASLGVGEMSLRTKGNWDTSWSRSGSARWGSGKTYSQAGEWVIETMGGPAVELEAASPTRSATTDVELVLSLEAGIGGVTIQER